MDNHSILNVGIRPDDKGSSFIGPDGGIGSNNYIFAQSHIPSFAGFRKHKRNRLTRLKE